MALVVKSLGSNSHVILTPFNLCLQDIFFSHPLKCSLSHLLLYQHCGKTKWVYASTCTTGVTQSVQMAFARFSFTACNRGTCNKVWNAAFKFNHISELVDTYPFAGGLLSGCLSQCISLFRDYSLQGLFFLFLIHVGSTYFKSWKKCPGPCGVLALCALI